MPTEIRRAPTRAGKDVAVHLNYLANLALYDQVKPIQAVPGFLDTGHKSNIKLEQGPLETIHDIRGLPQSETFDLERNGFEYIQQETKFRDWNNQSALENVYVPEIEQLIKEKVPGADEVHIIDVRLRHNEKIGTKNQDGLHKNPYARQVHVDDTATSLTSKFHGVEDMRAAWFDRTRVINVWRPINHPVYDCALAICDASSLRSGDVIECDRIRLESGAYHDTMGVVKYRPGYEWYYMSEQQPDEVVMFTQHDSDVVNKKKPSPGCSLHTAFDVPGPLPLGSKPRESVEVRAFVWTYPTVQCKIKPPLTSCLIASALPIQGSNTQHQSINTRNGNRSKPMQREELQTDLLEKQLPSTELPGAGEEHILDDLRLHEIILLRRQVEQLVEVNRKLKKGIESRLDAERMENPAHVERAVRAIMTALSLDREYSWDAAEMWRKECGEQPVRMGYLPTQDKRMDQLIGHKSYV